MLDESRCGAGDRTVSRIRFLRVRRPRSNFLRLDGGIVVRQFVPLLTDGTFRTVTAMCMREGRLDNVRAELVFCEPFRWIEVKQESIGSLAKSTKRRVDELTGTLPPREM